MGMKGEKQHSKGRKLPDGDDPRSHRARCASELGAALRRGMTLHRTRAKTVMRWTDAGERAVKAWRSGASIPRGDHLIALMRHSDEVFLAVLRLSHRSGGSVAEVVDWRNRLAAIVVAMDHAREKWRREGAAGRPGLR